MTQPLYDDNGPPEGWQRTIAMLLAVEEAANDAIADGQGVADAEVAIKVVRPELKRLMAMRPLPLRQRIANQLADERCRTRGWVKRLDGGRVFWGPK